MALFMTIMQGPVMPKMAASRPAETVCAFRLEGRSRKPLKIPGPGSMPNEVFDIVVFSLASAAERPPVAGGAEYVWHSQQ